MDEAKFRRIRETILDSTTFVSRGVCFDTDNAHVNGYSDEEIADAEYLLTESSFFTKDFVKEIEQITDDTQVNFIVYFVEFAKIIFMVHEDSPKSRYFFEEDLQKMVLLKQYRGFSHEFLMKKPAA